MEYSGKTAVIALLAAASIASMGGCTSKRGYPTVGLERSVSSTLPAATEGELQDLLTTPINFTAPVHAAIVWLYGPESAPSLPDAERIALLQSFENEIDRYPFRSVSILPTEPVPLYRRDSGSNSDSLQRLRAASARLQADVLVLIETETEEYVDWNPLAVTYFALLPALFMPGEQPGVYTSVEVCAIDVRTGVFLGCAQGHGKAERRLGFRLARQQTLRKLSIESARQALHDLPLAVRRDVSARMSPGRVIGLRYETE